MLGHLKRGPERTFQVQKNQSCKASMLASWKFKKPFFICGVQVAQLLYVVQSPAKEG